MNGLDLRGPFDIAHVFDISKNAFIPIDLLPKQLIDGRIIVGKNLRCFIRYKKRENRGGYGSIHRIQRTPSLGKELCVKSPHSPTYSLCPEAILQWHASEILRRAGIYGAIPHIYDIFQYAGETRFTMDFINGRSALQCLTEAADPDFTWLQILAQVSLLLGYLEETIYLDHRDLKADNIWIRETPVDYSLSVGGIVWKLKAPFQVVLLDFGFACLGNDEGHSIISLSDGIVPKIDPCPKEGRDLFQLIASVWSIPIIRERASRTIQNEMESLLTFKNTSYVHIIKQAHTTHWIYLAVSDARFRHPPLHPVSLLLKLSADWPSVGLYK